MADSQIISMGSFPKFRGEYDDKTVYYYKNVVTHFGCVFQAIGNNFSNVSPISVNEDGEVSLAHENVWNVIIDNTAIYNAALPRIPWTEQVKGLQTDYKNLNQRLITEIKNRSAVDSSFESKIGAKAGNGIAQLVDGKVPKNQLPSEMLGVVILEFVRADGGSDVASPTDLGQYYYDVVSKKLYVSFKSTQKDLDGQIVWGDCELSKDKLYIDRSGRGIYMFANDELIKIAPQNDDAIAKIEEIAKSVSDERSLIEKSIHGRANNLNILFMEKSDYKALQTYEEGVLYFVYQEQNLTPVKKPENVVYYYSGASYLPEPSKFYVWTGEAESLLGTYKYVAKLNPGFKWEDGTKDDVIVSMTIKEAQIAKPVSRKFAYDGNVHTLASTDMYSVEGKGGTEIGDYHFKITLKYGYVWMDGTHDAVYVIYSVVKAINDKWTFGSAFPIRFNEK